MLFEYGLFSCICVRTFRMDLTTSSRIRKFRASANLSL